MTKHARSIQILNVEGLPGTSDQSLTVRVEALIRRAILSGNLARGVRLPSSRILAGDLHVSRHTVEHAFDQLVSEGFVTRRRGSGTFVAVTLPERAQPPLGEKKEVAVNEHAAITLSKRGAAIAAMRGRREALFGTAFTPSVPAVEFFPREIWSRFLSDATRRAGIDYWSYGASNGLPELRNAIAAHIAGSRAVACTPDQIIVLTSAQQAVDLVARVLLDVGDVAWVEDPCYPLGVQILKAAGANVCPVPVDSDGFNVDDALERNATARLAYVTPSHQYPSGELMSLPRRQALLAWAKRERAWIIEDDYDGDIRYVGRPLASLQGLDDAGRVIYIGTFNKMMFSSLRLAFLVAPPLLVEPFMAAKHMMDGHAPLHTQAAMARFMDDGHLATHLRRSVSEYDERRRALLTALKNLSDEFEVGPADAGLHITAYLRNTIDDRSVARECRRAGVVLDPLSRFYLGPSRSGFVLGFACSSPSRTEEAMRTVARAIRKVVR
ncbi:MAG: PLP-dependent aminotransferase family protein [Gemmatimonadaceae bacterium]